MLVGLVGVGRMGRALAARLKEHTALCVYDRDFTRLKKVAAEFDLETADNLEELADLGNVILAVPDREVISCIKLFNQLHKPLTVINIATNVDRHILKSMAAPHVRCINVKIVGHADEMILGQQPVVIVDERPFELVPVASDLFSGVGEVLVGRADLVSLINTIAAEKVLVAAVNIEETLRQHNIEDQAVIKAAIRQVAVGILKAYTDNDLGPFAREVVQAIKAKMKK